MEDIDLVSWTSTLVYIGCTAAVPLREMELAKGITSNVTTVHEYWTCAIEIHSNFILKKHLSVLLCISIYSI